MPPQVLTWESGTRGPYPGRWLVYRNKLTRSPRLIQTPGSENIQPTISARGEVRPWDWCHDAMYFDPTLPWLAFIPTWDPARYENSANKQSWIFPDRSDDPASFRPSSRGGFTASLGIIEHAGNWLPRIKSLADELKRRHGFPHSLPDIPDVNKLALRRDTSDEVLANLWTFRRPILSLLGYIHYYLTDQYLSVGRSARDCPALQNEDVLKFICNHLFTGQGFRGVLIETKRFCEQWERDPRSCEPILRLFNPKLSSPIPLVVHQPPSCGFVQVPQLNEIFSQKVSKASLGGQTAYMMKDCAARSGFICNSKIKARAQAHYHSVTLQSELDGVNLILFFFDKPLTNEDEDEDEDDSYLADLEAADFGDFQPQKLRRIYDALFFFDSGKKLEKLLATQKAVPGGRPTILDFPMSRTGEDKCIPFEIKLNHLIPDLKRGPDGLGETEATPQKKTRPLYPVTSASSSTVAVVAPPPPPTTLPSYSPSLEWIKMQSLLAPSGIPLDLTAPDIIKAKPEEITQSLSRYIQSIHYSPGLCSAWVAESSLARQTFGHLTPIQGLESLSTQQSFIRGLKISLPWKTELILLSYVEQTPGISGEGLLRFSLLHGMPVLVFWNRELGKEWADAYANNHPKCDQFHEVLSPCPLGEKLTTAQMCEQWKNRIQYIFHRQDGIRLIFYGGYLSRLALQIMGSSYFQDVLQGPSHLYLAHKRHIPIDIDGEWDSYDSEIHAKPENDTVLQDVIGSTTSDGLSLWPPLNIFLNSDQWTGIWSDQNEAWFTRMWSMVNEGTLKPQPWGQRQGGGKLGACLRGQWPSERKAAAVRRAGEHLLRRLRSDGMHQFDATPVSTLGTLKL
ncbi:hypothetical protein BJ322DRAFT_1112317 [Thelephora terrestris]|uniref:Uncharacterized protein n=1 Tax=Thelephora terrestris TaxID=56493 RepID=A0A9P6H7I1_9AGAM|nr:hypothetical protein BJ322DRAFT_1112317 [Thelephora terrestris]